MDHQLVTLDGDEYDEFEQVGSAVWTDDQPPVRILTDLVDEDGVCDRVPHVVLEDAMSTGGRVDLHTTISYYETPNSTRVLSTQGTPLRRGGRRGR